MEAIVKILCEEQLLPGKKNPKLNMPNIAYINQYNLYSVLYLPVHMQQYCITHN